MSFGDTITVPCGRCMDCRLAHSRDWAIRCVHESQMHEKSSFLTLTYSDEHLPEGGTLDKRAFQLFAKRARKELGPLRYFHCGEYGDEFARAHYHACLFGQDFYSDRKLLEEKNGYRYYTSATLEKLWPFGHSMIGELTFESAAYVARYVTKKITGPKAEAHYGGKLPEYTTMSRRPGLASTWLDKFINDVYPHDYVVINGRKMKPPKYYDRKYEKIAPVSFKEVQERRIQNAREKQKNTTWERLEAKAKITKAKGGLYGGR